jgi:hypothetical protein
MGWLIFTQKYSPRAKLFGTDYKVKQLNLKYMHIKIIVNTIYYVKMGTPAFGDISNLKPKAHENCGL